MVIICWCGLVMSIYGTAQFFGIDQFFTLSDNPLTKNVTAYQVTGSMGHPNRFGSFILLCIPSAFYLKKYWMAALMVAGIAISQSMSAYIALAVGGVLWGSYKYKFVLILVGIGLTGILIFLSLNTGFKEKIFNSGWDNGRFGVWGAAIADVTTPFGDDGITYFWSGFGPGSFEYIFPGKNNSPFLEAKNEWLEIFYRAGFVGIVIVIKMIYEDGRKIFMNLKDNPMAMAFIYTLIIASVCALGIPIWHKGAHCFYTMVMVGVLYKLKENHGLQT